MMQNALAQQQEFQRRIDNQRKIINRYDGYRRWVLEHVVPDIETWAGEIEEALGAQGTQAASEMRALANRAKTLGEQPPEEWANA